MKVAFRRPYPDRDRLARLLSEAVMLDSPSTDQQATKLEKVMASKLVQRHTVATSTGSIANSLALSALRRQRPEARCVILPAICPVPQVNSVLHAGFDPIFVDVLDDLQMSPTALDAALEADEERDMILAVMPAHLLGIPAPIHAIREVAQQFDLPLVVDATQAPGISVQRADFTTYSFHSTSALPAGGGGGVGILDYDMVQAVRTLRQSGRRGPDDRQVRQVGFSGHIPELIATSAIVCLEALEEEIIRRRHNVRALSALMGENLKPPVERPAAVPYGFPLLYATREERNAAFSVLGEWDIEAQHVPEVQPLQVPAYRYQQAYYRNTDRLATAERLSGRGLYIPIHGGLTHDHLEYCVQVIRRGPAPVSWEWTP